MSINLYEANSVLLLLQLIRLSHRFTASATVTLKLVFWFYPPHIWETSRAFSETFAQNKIEELYI